MKRVIIAGSRTFDDYGLMEKTLDDLFTRDDYGEVDFEWPATVLCGMANGADLLGKDWAETLNIPVEEYPADWEKHGPFVAAIIRNNEMAEKADVLVAFWDGESRGTRHMINAALEHGLEVHVYVYKTKSSS